jgi:propanol-preferring alcohol dehydrogenase
VRVEGSGFCHSDLHVIEGEIRVLPRLPLTLGHENAGVVAEVGPGVTGVSRGDPVAVYGGWGCGSCDACVAGTEQLCDTPGWVGLSNYDGGYAEYLLVPHEKYLVRLERLEPRSVAPLTDAALTPYRAIRRALPYIQPDHSVLVIGLGGLGQYGVKLLRLLGGAPIIAVDLSGEKLETAAEYGATHLINAADPELLQKIQALSRGGVSATFDFVGSDATLAASFASTRSGGKVTQIGLAGGTAKMKVLDNVRFEVAFEATLWGNIRELREVVALAESGLLALGEVEFAPLAQINEVYARLKRGEIRGRAVITP